MSQPGPPQRELVFCHQCENEWYRDEYGLVCPECQSDFTEVIELDRDLREEDAPDPEEDDLDQFEWRNNAPGEPPGGHARFHQTITLGPGQDQGAAALGGLMGLFGPAIQGILGNIPQQQQGQAPADAEHGDDGNETQQPQHRGGTIRGEGPGYAYTITTSLNSSNLQPRDAANSQPVQTDAVDIGTMMRRMVANIGIAPGNNGDHGNPMGIEDILAMFGGAGFDGMHGDAVHSQQAYDRVISRLMEEHAAGHAPPPASEDAIEALPRRNVGREDLDDAGKADCSICINEVNIGDEITVLPCDHWFHHECVKAWLISHDTCPHCRKGIMPKENTDSNRPRNPSQVPQNDPHSQESQQQQQPTGVANNGRPRR